ncbi:FAD-dependent oxidoreductase [Fictibacillus nanhaiensis]|nr:FAD-dependent oxidoreductase [Fictibacillus nanhaiensis]MBY6037599.1 FAD-dependent oxidoreductase [Fictibacillus nanhaiensis]
MSHILLVGGGHAHLSILRNLLNETARDFEVTLISSSKYQYYSGMFSGFTEGLYSEEEIRIDLESLCKKASVSFIEDTIISFDPLQKVLLGFSGGIYNFDVISFDIGSGINSELTKTIGLNIKPNYQFPDQIKTFRSSEKPVVIGGGSAGVELALSTLAWRRKKNRNRAPVTLISSSPLLDSYGAAATKKIRGIAKNHDLRFYENEQVEDVTEDYLLTSNGSRIAYSAILPVTGPKASSIFKQALLPIDKAGFMMVEDTLQNHEFPFVFGAGDCVTLAGYEHLPKNGVYAVRQGPVLWKNIKNYLSRQSLDRFYPQKKFVSILSTGNQNGLFTYGGFAVQGKWAWTLKNMIDKRFMNKHH